MYVSYVEYNDRRMDFDVTRLNIVVVRRFLVVHFSHQDDKQDAKQESVHYLPKMKRKRKSAFECKEIINIIQKRNLHLEDRVHMLGCEYFA